MKTYIYLALAVFVVANAACGSAGMRAPVAATTDDNTIAVRVRTALQNAPAVHPQEIQVEVDARCGPSPLLLAGPDPQGALAALAGG